MFPVRKSFPKLGYISEEASQSSFWIFFTFALFLALSIFGGNLLVLTYVFTSNRTNQGIVRAALAVAEIQTSVLLFSITLPKIVWTLESTPMEIFLEVENSLNAVYSQIGGVYFMYCTTSFLFLLTFLSYAHFAAVKWPLKTTQESRRRLLTKLAIVWLIALVPATYPCWFPKTFMFSYNYFCFLFLPDVEKSSASLKQGFIFISLLFPAFTLMTFFTVATIVLIRRNSKRRRGMTSNHYVYKIRTERHSSYAILVLLEIAFTVTLLPSIVAYSLYFVSDESTLVILISNYLTMCNGMMNFVIFWWKDGEFNKYLKNLQRKWKSKLHLLCRKTDESNFQEIHKKTSTNSIAITKM